MSAPTYTVDIGFSGPTVGDVFTIGDAVRGEVDLYPIAGDIWVDVTPYVRSWRVRYGATRGDEPILRYEAATAVIELNDGDRRFDSENLAGPYVAAGVSQVEPMRRVRIRLVWDGTSYPVFSGFSDDFRPQYIGNDHTVTTLTATDAMKVFGANDRGASVATGAGEDAGARITRILDALAWPAADRLISVGDTTVQATTLEGNALAELQLTQDTEAGEFYINRSGQAVFRNRQAMVSETRSNTAQAVFGDGGLLATGEIPYADVAPSTGAESMANRITITRVGGAPQEVEDSVSVSRFLVKTFPRTDLIMETDAAALSYANMLLYQFGTPQRRFTRIDFKMVRPHEAATAWPQLLGRELADRVTVFRRPAGGGDPIERDCFIRGVEMEHTQKDELKIGFILQSAGRYSFFVINDPVLGVVGSNAIAF
jgi:hypothetical protein